MKLFRNVISGLFAVLLAGCAAIPAAGEKEPEYRQVITVLEPVDRVPVIVSYQGGGFYRVQVRNNRPDTIRLVWDESAYVNTGGESIRLIRVPDRNKLPSQPGLPQADSPIAPGSQLLADFVGESWLKLVQGGATPKPKAGFRKARIYLQFDLKGKWSAWRGEVAFVPRKQP